MYKLESLSSFVMALCAFIIGLATCNTDFVMAIGWFVIAAFGILAGFMVREHGAHEKGRGRHEIGKYETLDEECPDVPRIGENSSRLLERCCSRYSR